MGTVTNWLDKTLYSNYEDNWDDTLLRETILQYLTKESVCLDFGAGRGNVQQMNFRGLAKQIIGADIDSIVRSNPNLDSSVLIESDRIELPSNYFDIIYSDNVLEHLPNPEKSFNEIQRLLKPGGVFIAKTPNRFHYMPLVATLTPTWFHRWYNKLRGRETSDTFPTLYRANSEYAIHNLAKHASMNINNIRTIEGRPEYLRLNALTYLVGCFYEKLVNATNIFRIFRCVIIVEMVKNEQRRVS